MNAETVQNVAEVAAHLAQAANYTTEEGRFLSPVPAYVAAREAVALAALSRRAHRYAERMCNEDMGDEAKVERAQDRHQKAADAILSRFGLFAVLQYDPRGWPLSVYATAEDADSGERCGSPRPLFTVTPRA